MSTANEDRRSPIEEMLEGIPFRDIGSATALAPETPLTRESAIHLRAAAREIDEPLTTVRSILRTVERALADEPQGGPKHISEARRMDLARLLTEADRLAGDAACAVFERGRGERAHGGIVEGDAEVAS